MATWEQVKAFIYTIRTVEGDTGDALKMTVGGDNGRSQLLFVARRETSMDLGPAGVYEEEWAVLQSPICRTDEVEAARVLEQTAGMVCGGLGLLQLADGVYIALRHAVPLKNLDSSEIEGPMLIIAAEADQLEATVLGVDRL
jgi:hypothetical protein